MDRWGWALNLIWLLLAGGAIGVLLGGGVALGLFILYIMLRS